MRIIPGRQIVSRTVVFKQRMLRDIFPVEGELSVFSNYLKKQTVLKNYLHLMKGGHLSLVTKEITFSVQNYRWHESWDKQTVRTGNIIRVYILGDFLYFICFCGQLCLVNHTSRFLSSFVRNKHLRCSFSLHLCLKSEQNFHPQYHFSNCTEKLLIIRC